MLHERDFEDIIFKYPELIEDGLIIKGRKVTFYGRRMDLLFEDQFKSLTYISLTPEPRYL